jgi:hypothetical protein
MADRAPIALFIYNRPQHTARTLASLAANPLATESDLVVYADGPKTPEHEPSVQAARSVVREARGFKSVRVVERERNLGLANSIISGVTEICDAQGSVVVVEDDLDLSPGFLTFMNEGLERYRDEERVMQISGYVFAVDRPEELPAAFFLRLSATWGWATWKRAWDHLETDASRLLGQFSNEASRDFDLGGAYPYFQTLVDHDRGTLNVWGVRWYASMFLRGGLCLHPARPLVNNIGMDGSGEHCTSSTAFEVKLAAAAPAELPERIEVNEIAEAKVRRFLTARTRPSLKSLAVAAKRRISSILKG